MKSHTLFNNDNKNGGVIQVALVRILSQNALMYKVNNAVLDKRNGTETW
jgi:hypothetical protein